MAAKTVLISGASIGGPALAYWLRRYGFEPTVVEIAPALRPGGQAVDLRGAGKIVADRFADAGWRVPEFLEALGPRPTSTSTRSPRWTSRSGRAAGWSCSATPATAARRWPEWAPA
jgi:2-polyprenyl-6-methoxyphenol hydroxylase-like FAD-dependent oxidoreductase